MQWHVAFAAVITTATATAHCVHECCEEMLQESNWFTKQAYLLNSDQLVHVTWHFVCCVLEPHGRPEFHIQYLSIEPSSFVRELLPQRVCDGHETHPYYSATYGECHKGVGGKRFIAPVKSAARIPLLQKYTPCCVFTDDECELLGMLCVYMCEKKSGQSQKGDARALWHTKVQSELQLQNEGTAKKIPSRETVG